MINSGLRAGVGEHWLNYKDWHSGNRNCSPLDMPEGPSGVIHLEGSLVPPNPPLSAWSHSSTGENLYRCARDCFGYHYPNYDVTALARAEVPNIPRRSPEEGLMKVLSGWAQVGPKEIKGRKRNFWGS
jgi:hypothetical protein